jgi:hypothetical protein
MFGGISFSENTYRSSAPSWPNGEDACFLTNFRKIASRLRILFLNNHYTNKEHMAYAINSKDCKKV